MAEILHNQEITTTTLNNIAIDLGATSFNGFTTNKFGADALNDITKAIVSKGVTLGANKCKPYISYGKLYISSGTIIFESGAKIRIINPQPVTAEPSTYIYALNDTVRNIAQIVVADRLPTTGDFVMLAYLDENGAVSDRRQWAQSNVLLATTNYPEIPLTFDFSTGQSLEVPVSWDGYSRIIYKHWNRNIYGFDSTLCVSQPINGNYYVGLPEMHERFDASVKKSNGNLLFSFKNYGQWFDYNGTIILV